ncbi:MAG: rod shape-determining protein MreC [Prolixibacteraceae bacterium]|jgi:rod shape-determining protein MreC|nr:rod shape-determining protein MreC [Prolixibacteraceae bacterium]HNQ38402.1 rod shape-determining protein MreC [Prolixibacteraceae bacterium]HPJ78459.1 rod shape-determining protein MreC [Prolixibacteraceae bacterium]HRV89615.1 rod shape-determining protein MreC [Prolixibacteraceae bacterium]
MRNLFRFILQNHVFLLFLLLEVVSLIFIFNFNRVQKSRFLNTSGRITGTIYESYSKIEDFFRLPSVNRELAEENARLRMLLAHSPGGPVISDSLLTLRSGGELQYRYIAARVISTTVNRQQNFITIDKGLNDGIRPDMGVITVGGVAGIITHVSPSYATGLSLLNTRWNVSAKLARNNYFGSLVWDGRDYRKAALNEIPFHVELAVGDTVVTSGYSSFFPEGVLLGTVESFEKGGGDNFYSIRVNLSVDFRSLTYVEVIENTRKDEIERINRLHSGDEDMD